MSHDWRQELVDRAVRRYDAEHGPLSEGALEELAATVAADPDPYLRHPSDRALALLVEGLKAYEQSRQGDEFLDDEAYLKARAERMERLQWMCLAALADDENCADAKLVQILMTDQDALEQVAALRALDAELAAAGDDAPGKAPATGDPWDDVFARPRLRVQGALAIKALDAANVAMALDTARGLMDSMADDGLGMRYTAALALARLEDEEGFDALDARFGRHGNAWSNLARALMLYKLDRMAAARRALAGFTSLNEGAAYALLRPTYVEPYLPYRPDAAPGSYEEAVLAVHEADPIVVDAPDFVNWCAAQPGMTEQAAAFAQANGLDW